MSKSARTVSARIRPPVNSGTLTVPAYVYVGITEEGSVPSCAQLPLKCTEGSRAALAAFFWLSAARIRSCSAFHSGRAARLSSMLASTSGCGVSKKLSESPSSMFCRGSRFSRRLNPNKDVSRLRCLHIRDRPQRPDVLRHHQQDHLLARGETLCFAGIRRIPRGLVPPEQRQIENRSVEGRPCGENRIRPHVPGESREYPCAAKLREDVDTLPLLRDAELCLRQQLGQRDLLVLLALRRRQNCNLCRRILFQRERHRLVQRQPQYPRGRVRRQRAFPRVLRSRQCRAQEQSKKRDIKNDVRALGRLSLAFAIAPGNLSDNRLIEATVRSQSPALAVDQLQQLLTCGIDERHSAKVDAELLFRRSRPQLPPELLQRWNRLPCETPLHHEHDLAALFFCADSEHKTVRGPTSWHVNHHQM